MVIDGTSLVAIPNSPLISLSFELSMFQKSLFTTASRGLLD